MFAPFLKVEEATSGKLLVYLGDGKPVAVLLRGDHEANEAKVRRAIGVATWSRPTPRRSRSRREHRWDSSVR